MIVNEARGNLCLQSVEISRFIVPFLFMLVVDVLADELRGQRRILEICKSRSHRQCSLLIYLFYIIFCTISHPELYYIIHKFIYITTIFSLLKSV